MKYLKTYEGQNTKNWYSILSNLKELESNFNKLLDNQVEDAKFFECKFVDFIILAYLSKNEHKKFKKWILQPDISNYLLKLEAIKAIEIYDIEKYIEDIKIKYQASKYNI